MTKFACNEEGVSALKAMASAITDAITEIKEATSSLRIMADEEGEGLGPHLDSLCNALDDIESNIDEISEEGSDIAEILNDVADGYQDVIDSDPFSSSGGSGGGTGGSGGGAGGSGGSGSGGSSGGSDSIDTSKETVDKNTEKVKATCSTEYAPFEKEKSTDIGAVMDRGGCSKEVATEAAGLSEGVFARAAKEEPKITKDIVGAVSAKGGTMYGLPFRMKQPTSMAGKIAGDFQSGDAGSLQDSANSIKDSVRYTAVFDSDSFTSGYNSVKSSLEAMGYREVRCKNFFKKYRDGKSVQKAVQCVYVNDKGFPFEVQFHTPETLGAKEVNHPLYEEARKGTTSTERRGILDGAMTRISSYSPVPKGVYDIVEHNS